MSTENREGGFDLEKEKQKFREEFLKEETKELATVIKELEERYEKERKEKGLSAVGHELRKIREKRDLEKEIINRKIERIKETFIIREDVRKRLEPANKFPDINEKIEANLYIIEKRKTDSEHLRQHHYDSSSAMIPPAATDKLEQENRILFAIRDGKL